MLYSYTLNQFSLGLRPNVIEIHLNDKDLRFISSLIADCGGIGEIDAARFVLSTSLKAARVFGYSMTLLFCRVTSKNRWLSNNSS